MNRIQLVSAMSSLFLFACGDAPRQQTNDLTVPTDTALSDFTDGKFHWNPYANFVGEDFLSVVRVAKDSLTVPKAVFDALAKPVVPGETILVGTGSEGEMDRNPGFVYEVSAIETVGTDVVIRGEHVSATSVFVGPLSNLTPPPNAQTGGLGLKKKWDDSVQLVNIGSQTDERIVDLRDNLGIPESKATRAGDVRNVAQLVYKYWATSSVSYLLDVQIPLVDGCGWHGVKRCTSFKVKALDVALHASAGAAARIEMSSGVSWSDDWSRSLPLGAGEYPLNCGVPCSLRPKLVLKCGLGWQAGASFSSTNALIAGQIDVGIKKEGDSIVPYADKNFDIDLPTINGRSVIPQNFSLDSLTTAGPPIQFSASVNGYCSIVPELEFVIGIDRWGFEGNVKLIGAVDFKASAAGHACAQYTPRALPLPGVFSDVNFGGSFDFTVTPEVRGRAGLGFEGHGFYKDFGPFKPVGTLNLVHREVGSNCP